MTDSEALTAHEQQLWRELGRLTHALPRLLEDDMNRATGLTMTDFAVLLMLGEAPGQRMRMAELAAKVGLTPSRITRVVDGLCTRALATKERDPADARGNVAALTATGLTALHAAEPHHLASARRRVLDHVPADAVPALADALHRITTALINPKDCPDARNR
ncbi:MarR family winged helix-turn-helix transcriptional regulator [Streptomyces sp. NPDC020096]